MAERWLLLLASSLAAASSMPLWGCGAKTAETPSESKTNWLKACDSDAECGAELACHCGVCTLNCEESRCPDALSCLGTCGEVVSCQAACSADTDCTYLSGNATCRGGVCSIEGAGLSANQVSNPPPEAKPLLEDAQFDAATVPAAEAALADDSGGAWRLIEVPAANTFPNLVATPIGWLALSSRSVGDSRAPSGYESVLYRSTDGVHWDLLPFDLPHADADLTSLAYGNGRYVIMGRRTGAIGVIWSSEDAEHWTEIEQTGDTTTQWGGVLFAGNHFFGRGFRTLGVSADGLSWTRTPISVVQVAAITYGKGRYVLVGSGPIETSDDGLTWEAHDLDCLLPGACMTTPPPLSQSGEPTGMGEIIQGVRNQALFAEGRFFTDQLSSADGVTWEAMPDRFPTAYVAGRFLGNLELATGLPSWRDTGELEALRVVRPAREGVLEASRNPRFTGVLDSAAPLPESVSVEFDDGLTCATATCIAVDGKLLLVPPPGTPPLPDRVPRKADGTPLLSDDCPVSAQLFCEDYETRAGCVCAPEAPHTPEWCDDVSQYQCQGSFSKRDGEWELDEIREGGCDCNYVDPNQPVGFGTDCSADMTVCAAPLECLPLQLMVSAGPPYQPYACTVACTTNADCPSWEATGFCPGPVSLRCAEGSCQPRACE